jgi:hypothetical protein
MRIVLSLRRSCAQDARSWLRAAGGLRFGLATGSAFAMALAEATALVRLALPGRSR